MKYHYKLEFDIKSNFDEIEEALEKISEAIILGFKNVNKVTEIEVNAKIIKIEVK